MFNLQVYNRAWHYCMKKCVQAQTNVTLEHLELYSTTVN